MHILHMLFHNFHFHMGSHTYLTPSTSLFVTHPFVTQHNELFPRIPFLNCSCKSSREYPYIVLFCCIGHMQLLQYINLSCLSSITDVLELTYFLSDIFFMLFMSHEIPTPSIAYPFVSSKKPDLTPLILFMPNVPLPFNFVLKTPDMEITLPKNIYNF